MYKYWENRFFFQTRQATQMSSTREKPQQPCEAMKLENVNSRGHELAPRVTSGGTQNIRQWHPQRPPGERNRFLI